MGKKKREHVVFDKMLQPRKAEPLKKINTLSHKRTSEIMNVNMYLNSNKKHKIGEG